MQGHRKRDGEEGGRRRKGEEKREGKEREQAQMISINGYEEDFEDIASYLLDPPLTHPLAWLQ